MGFHSWQELPSEMVTPLKSMRTFLGEQVRLEFMTFEPGYVGDRHRHSCEQISYVLKGRIKSMLDGEDRVLQAGDFLHIPGNQLHQVRSVEEETVVIEIFSPIEIQKVVC